jgi:alkylhydroperoxidase/carboxymuconolactone decarboxylase family protein YurZ
MLPADYPGLVNGQEPEEIAAAILQVLAVKSGERVRNHFSARFTIQQHLHELGTALQSVE